MSHSHSATLSGSLPSTDSPTPSFASQFPLEDDELLTVPEDVIVAACEKVPSIAELSTAIKRISENAVVKVSKFVCQSEARNMQFVAANTSVRVPRFIRSFEVPVNEDTKITYIVMEYVRGEVLTDCWDDMSEARRECVCDKVSSAIAELQSLQVDRPGPIGGGRSTGTWFTTLGAGPFHSVRELEDWFTHKLDVCKRYNRAYASAPPFTGKFGKIVMSHMDLAPRNIILEGDDNICLIDWDFAGAYPVHFERAGLLNQGRDADFCKRMLARMKPYEQEIKDLISVRWAITSAYLV